MSEQNFTADDVKEWKKVYNEYRDLLLPDMKSSGEVISYVTGKYVTEKINSELYENTVTYNIVNNDFFREQIPEGKSPVSYIYKIKNTAKGIQLYENREKIFSGTDIIFGIELLTCYIYVEGSSELYDEIFAYRGLNEKEINNFYLVSKYISCLKKYGILNKIIK